ncbi:MAG: sugar-binding transcriptional regulator [Shimia sp.]
MDIYDQSRAQRLRAAWLYYGHGMTQADVAARLGISRSTVQRLLDEARGLQEVRVTIADRPGDVTRLELALEDALGVPEVIVAPGEGTNAAGIALGMRLSDLIVDGMAVGVGWGRTLGAALAAFAPPRRYGVHVVSLLGGSEDPQLAGAFEFAWRLAGRLGAECQLFPAPVVVEDAAVRRSLLEFSGMQTILDRADALDVAIFSVGDVGRDGTSLAERLVPPAEYGQLIEAGAVADILCHFIDAGGRDVPHPIAERLMSVPLASLCQARQRVLAAAGVGRVPALMAAVARTRPTTLVTDEGAARAMLARVSA